MGDWIVRGATSVGETCAPGLANDGGRIALIHDVPGAYRSADFAAQAAGLQHAADNRTQLNSQSH
jgi:hypothetical protein